MEEFFESELVKKFEEMIENNQEFYFGVDEYEFIINHYLDLGDISYAELALRYALKLHPDYLEIKIKELEILLELENYVNARILMKELENSCMGNIDFLVCCAKYYSSLGNPKRAIKYCEKALMLGEEENFLHNFIGDEYYNLDDPFNALVHYKQALKYDPQDDSALENVMSCYQVMNRISEALEFLNFYLDQYPFSEAGWYQYGQFHFNRKNYEEAITGFDYVLAINNEIVGVYTSKAVCYESMGNWKKAIEVYEDMLEIEYTKAFTYYRMGLCYKEVGQLTEALGAFQKSLREDPQFYMSMIEQSDIYLEMGSLKEALYFAKEAVSCNENNLEYQKKLAFLYISTSRFEESLGCLKKLISIEPERFYNWYACAEVLMLIGEYEEAVTNLNRAIKNHDRAELYYQLSNCYFNLKDKEKGRKMLSKAVEKDPNIISDMTQKYPFIREEIKKTEEKKNN